MEDIAMNANSVSIKSNRPVWMFALAALAALSLAFVWKGAGRMMNMQTHAAKSAEFAQLKPQESAKIVVEVTEASEGRIHGKLLEKQDETHYARSANQAEIMWNKDTAIVMGKAEDIHPDVILHVTGKVAADHSVQAKQIVILSGYVQVK
jgi:multidrug resistance efflux pump